MFKQRIPIFTFAALMAGCSTVGPAGGTGCHPTSADPIMCAAATFPVDPADKTPWVRMAQISYGAGDYGQAIMLAQQALLRDPNDAVSHSVAAVSGLRVASRALAELSRVHNLSGSAHSEAQDLTKLLRASLNEGVLVPPAMPLRRSPAKRP